MKNTNYLSDNLDSENTGENGEYIVRVHQLFIHLDEVCDSDRREVFYNILIEYGMPVTLFRPNKTYLK
jgi:hypothetical protein